MKAKSTLDECSQITRDWELDVNIEMVLRAQGVAPEILRKRQPRLVKVALRAIHEGKKCIHPRATFRRVRVQRIGSDRVLLDGGGELHGIGVTQRLSGARSVVLVVATLGDELGKVIAISSDPLYQLALHAFGTAAISELVRAISRYIRRTGIAQGERMTNPVYPGMRGWELSCGQKQIFSLIGARGTGVSLNRSFMMSPEDSVSFVIGVGAKVRVAHDFCEECEVSHSCRHKPLPH